MEQRNFLVYVRISEHEREGDRLHDAFRFVAARVKQLSNNDMCPLPIKQGDRCAMLLCRCGHDARWIVDDILRPEKHDTASRKAPDVDPMHPNDLVFVIELASDFSGAGVGSAAAWLQHRRNR